LESENVISFSTFGAPDSEEVTKYNDNFKDESNKFIVSKMTTIFPSNIEINEDKTYTIGGVILVKLQKKWKSQNFKC